MVFIGHCHIFSSILYTFHYLLLHTVTTDRASALLSSMSYSLVSPSSPSPLSHSPWVSIISSAFSIYQVLLHILSHIWAIHTQSFITHDIYCILHVWIAYCRAPATPWYRREKTQRVWWESYFFIVSLSDILLWHRVFFIIIYVHSLTVFCCFLPHCSPLPLPVFIAIAILFCSGWGSLF